MKSLMVLGAFALAAVGTSAHGATVLQIDVNSLTAVASGSKFDTSFTGALVLSKDASSNLPAVLRNGVGFGLGFGGPYNGARLAFSATFNFVAGDITGLGLSVGVDANGDNVIDNTYSTSVSAGVGNIIPDAGKPGSFIVAAVTNSGAFDSLTFGGVDVSDFFGLLSPGNFLNFAIDGALLNATSRSDTDVNVDIFVHASIIPLPSPAGLASVGLVGVLGLRRRRSS